MSNIAERSPAEKLSSLLGGDRVMCWLDIPSAMTAEIAAVVGFRAALIDLEHGPASAETLHAQLLALQAHGASAIVRTPETSTAWIKRILDLGPAGLMVPSVNSVDEAERAIAEFRYPPRGRRGFAAGVIRATGYGTDVDNWAARWNAMGVLILQIESRAGLEAAPEIAALDGVDSLFFGPADYATDLGVDTASAEVADAREEMRRIAQRAGKLASTLVRTGDDAHRFLDQGWDFVCVGCDVRVLRDSLTRDLAAAKGEVS